MGGGVSAPTGIEPLFTTGSICSSAFGVSNPEGMGPKAAVVVTVELQAAKDAANRILKEIRNKNI
tara:strand:- start:331 stop:525 length:195 start_codon:yes stop_codon:yes gene_type:complete